MQFKNLAEIQKFLERSDIVESVFKDSKVVDILRNEMQKAVHKVVYDQYEPRTYIRKMDDGGLSDKRNMNITKVEIKSGRIIILLENTRSGQTHQLPIYNRPLDSLNNIYITDTITNYKPNNWYRPKVTDRLGRHPSTARDYLTATVNNIKANPQPLINAIKSAYVKIGFKVK